MYKCNQKKLISSLALATSFFILTACSAVPVGQVNPNTGTQVKDNNTGEIKFSKVPAERLNQLNNYVARGLTPNSSPGITPNLSPSSAPMATGIPSAAATSTPALTSPTGIPGSAASDVSDPTPGPTDHDTPSINYPTAAPYYPPTPYYSSLPYPNFGSAGSFEEYTVIDFEEAHKDGFTGSYLSTLKSVINPIINSLATDARLISTYGNTDGKGKTIQPSATPPTPLTPYPTGVPYLPPTPGPYYYSDYNPYQWQFTFASSAKKEIYSVLVSASETLILRQKWGLRDLSPQNIKIDSTEAIEIVKKAVQDRNKPEPQQTPYPAYMTPGSYPPDSSVEEIYDIPENAVINYNLEKDKSTLEWNINFSYYNYQEANTSYSSGYATVNAITGEIIYFHRIFKYKYNPSPTGGYYYPTSNPYPYGTPTPYESSTATSSPEIDSTKAIEILKKAVRDKNIPDPQPSAAPNNSISEEAIYDIPESAVINTELQTGNGISEWNINFSYNNSQEAKTSYSSGYARINARTGEIIYFHRIFKYKYN